MVNAMRKAIMPRVFGYGVALTGNVADGGGSGGGGGSEGDKGSGGGGGVDGTDGTDEGRWSPAAVARRRRRRLLGKVAMREGVHGVAEGGQKATTGWGGGGRVEGQEEEDEEDEEGGDDSAVPRSSSSSSSRPVVTLCTVKQALMVSGGRPMPGTDPRGVVLPGWRSHFSRRLHDVRAEVIVADPLDASRPLRNAAEAKNRVVVAYRGGRTPLVAKVRAAQLAGALALIIVDTGPCDKGFNVSTCVAGSEYGHAESGFALQDHPRQWDKTTMPTLLVRRQDWVVATKGWPELGKAMEAKVAADAAAREAKAAAEAEVEKKERAEKKEKERLAKRAAMEVEREEAAKSAVRAAKVNEREANEEEGKEVIDLDEDGGGEEGEGGEEAGGEEKEGGNDGAEGEAGSEVVHMGVDEREGTEASVAAAGAAAGPAAVAKIPERDALDIADKAIQAIAGATTDEAFAVSDAAFEAAAQRGAGVESGARALAEAATGGTALDIADKAIQAIAGATTDEAFAVSDAAFEAAAQGGAGVESGARADAGGSTEAEAFATEVSPEAEAGGEAGMGGEGGVPLDSFTGADIDGLEAMVAEAAAAEPPVDV
jgi:hypothetical protein